MTLVAEIFGKSLPSLDEPCEDFLLPMCYMGVEMELEQFHTSYLNSNLRRIRKVMDNSLRNDGCELIFNSNQGYRGKELQLAIDELYKVLSKSSFDPSWRCSTHLHIDVRDLEQTEYLKFIQVCSIVEPYLISLYPDRIDNPYCRPLSSVVKSIKLNRLLSNLVNSKDLTYLGAWPKYTAINYRATREHGSVEFRIFEPVLDKETLLKYINIIMLIKDITKNLDEITIESVSSIYQERLGITLVEDSTNFNYLGKVSRYSSSDLLPWVNPIESVVDSEETVEIGIDTIDEIQDTSQVSDIPPSPPINTLPASVISEIKVLNNRHIDSLRSSINREVLVDSDGFSYFNIDGRKLYKNHTARYQSIPVQNFMYEGEYFIVL